MTKLPKGMSAEQASKLSPEFLAACIAWDEGKRTIKPSVRRCEAHDALGLSAFTTDVG